MCFFSLMQVFFKLFFQLTNYFVILQFKSSTYTLYYIQRFNQTLMRYFYLPSIVIIATLAACSGKKQDTALAIADSTTEEELPEQFESDELPMAADKLFDDFMYYFAINEDLQRRRINFPLKVTQPGKKTVNIEEEQWKMNSFFMDSGEFTVIYEKPEQWELVNDTAVNHVTVEKIFLDRDSVWQYIFNREDGRWKMTGIKCQRMSDNVNAQFLKFYQAFASDSAFQQNSLGAEIAFSGPDPDDDFSQMEGFISPASWDAFAPELPKDSIYNIVYGKQDNKSKVKILKICGISNGLQTELVFEQAKGKWLLTKLNE